MMALGIFAIFFSAGVVLAAVYLLLHPLFRGKLATFLCDLFFCAFSLSSVAVLFVFASDGTFRLYTIAALALGVAVSAILFKPTLDKLSSSLYTLLTTRLAEANDGKVVLQKMVGNIDGGCNPVDSNFAACSADATDAVRNAETAHSKVGTVGKRRRRQSSGK